MCEERNLELKSTETVVENEIKNSSGIAEIFKGENGPIYAGMIGIVFVAAIGLFSKGRYKLNVTNTEGSVSLEPA